MNQGVSQYSRNINPTLIGKIVISFVSLIFFMILSSVSWLNVSTPVVTRMTYFFPFDWIKPVQGIVERIEQIRFCETGNP